MLTILLLSVPLLFAPACSIGDELPHADEAVSIELPDFGKQLRQFDRSKYGTVDWWPYVVNAGWGGGRGGPERKGGWLDKNWQLIDYIDRSGDYTTHDYLTNHGIWYEVYGSNEYQETIHFVEKGARKLLWENGIARNMHGDHVLSRHYNTSHDWWAKKVGWDAYIVCNNAPRWWAIINYDWLTSPLLGFAISQDNIGGPTSRIGAGGHGRYCDYCNDRFFEYLDKSGRLPQFRNEYDHIRQYVQDNLMDVVKQLPPHVKPRWDAEAAKLWAKMCAPPVMSEYQKVLYMSHLHNLMRNYRDAKLVARRMGKDYDVHGNQGGGFIGPNPYQIALGQFVDTVWFESSGLSTYDIFKHNWYNAWGALRFEIGRAMTRGWRPFMSMTKFRKDTADLVEHEMAEECAGGAVLFVDQKHFAEKPKLLKKMEDYFRFRHEHRGIFARENSSRYSKIAVVYSIPTMMYHAYQYSTAEPVRALSGLVRALYEGHLQYDIVILNHPEIHDDGVDVERLRSYDLVILPAVDCMADRHADMLKEYLRGGGKIAVIGECGLRNENNRPRQRPVISELNRMGQIVRLIPDKEFFGPRGKETRATRQVSRAVIDQVTDALPDNAVITGQLPRMLWTTTWTHGNRLLTAHFVNYDIDFETGKATPTEPAQILIELPEKIPPQQAAWLVPGQKPQQLNMTVEGNTASVTIPAVDVYGVLAIGRQGLDELPSAVLQGDALLARAQMATDGGQWPQSLSETGARVTKMKRRCHRENNPSPDLARKYAAAAGQLLTEVQQTCDRKYLRKARNAVATDGAIAAFDFGADSNQKPWTAVSPDDEYSTEAGYGWLPVKDNSTPTPEEKYYDAASKYGEKFLTGRMRHHLLFWPYDQQRPPRPLRYSISSGTQHRFRADVPDGNYIVRISTTNPSWTNRNFMVSGMVTVNGAVRLPDATHDCGAIVTRQFRQKVTNGRLRFTFGGPTGWAVSAVIIEPAVASEENAPDVNALRNWTVSGRYSNPDWYPIRQTSTPIENRPGEPATDDWQKVHAPQTGLPVVDLGTNQQAQTGDTVYAVTALNSDHKKQRKLHFSCSSQAQLWLNGRWLGYVPNEKGLRRGEFTIAVNLQRGRNTLLVKLQRFWERHWMFSASVAD